MSYSPVNVDSRGNSPVPSSYRSNMQQQHHGYNQNSSKDRSPFLQNKSYGIAVDQDPLASPPTRNPFEEPASSFINQDQLNPQQRPSSQYMHLQPQPYVPYDKDHNQLSISSGYQPSSHFTSTMRPQHGQHGHHGQHGTGTGAGTSSSSASYDGRQDMNSSHRSSAHNLAMADRNYNLTQNDTTLEGLAERWQAYQAWWAKQYKEQPFYRLWTRSKWILFFSAVLLLGYSAAAFTFSLGYVLGRFEHSAVVLEFHKNIVYITLAGSSFGILSALIGFVGIFRENRRLLSLYNIMLWIVFSLYISVGYIAFRRAKNHLRARLRDEWLNAYTREQRLLVQRSLKCCGYQSPTWYGEYDMRCFPMINLPGCQHKYSVYEADLLHTCWTFSFILAPFQLFVMIATLLCSNHVDGMFRSGRPGLKSFKEQ